jgi:hypothetical protein
VLIRSNEEALADRRRVIAAPSLQPQMADEDGVPVPWPPVLNVSPADVAAFQAEWDRARSRPLAFTLVHEVPDLGLHRPR